MTDQQNEQKAPVKPRTPFTVALNELDQGRVADEATDALTTVVAAVRDTGKKASLTLTIEVAPVKGSSGEQVLVVANVATKLPRHDRPVSFYFATRDGELTRDIPGQPPLFPAPSAAPIREV